jgi:CheY-like chemotaxis protein
MNAPAPDSIAKGRSILLVDDETIVLDVGRAILQRLGHDVLLARSGEDALKQYHQHEEAIGCVVLDLTMPGMDGETTYRRLRELNPQLPIVIASGLPAQAVRDLFSDTPPADIIQKPFQVADLSEKMTRLFKPD